MNVLVIGSGAREHALAHALAADGAQLYSAGPAVNPGIAALDQGRHLACRIDQVADIATFARDHGIGLAVPGGEDTLAAGVVDALAAHGIKAVGPTRELARLESSKSFARDFLQRHRLPGNPRYFCVDTPQSLRQALKQLPQRYVLKADGLCGGKGVQLFGQQLHHDEQALAFGCHLLNHDRQLVVEELLQGQEFSLLSFTDGSACVHAPLVQDHKRAHDGDLGPNTGGMGSYSLSSGSFPFVDAAEWQQARQLNEAVLSALASETGQDYRGVLYGSYMVTADGVRLIEFNVRCGDPEVLNLVGLLDGSWLELLTAITEQRLAAVNCRWRTANSLCKYLVPQGYPGQPCKGEVIAWPADTDLDLYYGAVEQHGSGYRLLGSRAVAFVAQGDEPMEQVYQRLERACSAVRGPVYYRRDIGSPAALQTKSAQMAALRRERAEAS